MLMFDVSRYKNSDKYSSLSGQWGDRSKSQESGVVAMMVNLGCYKNGNTSSYCTK